MKSYINKFIADRVYRWMFRYLKQNGYNTAITHLNKN